MDDLREQIVEIISKNEGEEEVKFKYKDENGEVLKVNVKKLLKYIPVAQIRTNKSKPFVFIISEDYVLKGPMTEKRYENVISRSKKFVKLEIDDIIVPVFCSIVIGGEKYIAFKRIKSRNGPTKEYTEKTTGYTYEIMERTSVDKLSSFLPDEDIYTSSQFKRYIFCMCICFILNVGDMGPHNTLYDQKRKKIYIIDYDDTSGKDRDDEYFYFSKRVAKKFQMYNYTYKIHKEIIPDLKKIKDKLKDKERYELCIENLKKYSDKKVNAENKSWFYIYKHGTTYSKYKVDEVKSGLQKYIRRNMRSKAVMCAMDLIKLGEGGRKTLCTRLKVIAVEDIGIANIDLVLYTINYIDNKEPDDKKLIQLVVLLCESDHSRAGSHINKYFKNKPDMEVDKEKMKKYMDKYKAKRYNKGDNKHLIKYLCKFEYWYSKEKSLNCIYYVIKISNMSFTKDGPLRLGHTNPMRKVWEIMDDGSFEFDLLNKCFWSQTEKRPFLMMYLMIKLVIDDYEYELPDTSINKKYYKYIDGDYDLELDDYVFDMHTAKGRSKGKNRSDFIEEGSYVANEYIPNEDFQIYKDEYERND